MQTATRSGVLRMPRVNANEDGATIVGAPLAPGDRFEPGTLLFEIETTKATLEIEAPFGGTVTQVPVEPGREYAVGTVILQADLDAEARAEGDWSLAAPPAAKADGAAPNAVSLKARMRARELGVDVAAVRSEGGRVTVADVEAHHAAAPARPSAEGVTLLDRYEFNHALVVGEGGHALTVEDAAAGSGLVIAHRMSLRPEEDDPGVRLLDRMRERGLRQVLIGVGGATGNATRARLFDFLLARGLHLPPLVARGAHLGSGAVLGRATYLFAGCVVGPAARLGDDCIVNHGAIVCHDSVVGDHVHLTPGATVAGGCRIGDRSTIGMNASIMNGVAVGRNCLVHNNAAVARDVADDVVVTA